ncbi:MAG: hypothetical protein JXR37_19040 [Kiritimatiellae bacterium]|nr:hypothetical protein [Kiritimatiellia bacterium]
MTIIRNWERIRITMAALLLGAAPLGTVAQKPANAPVAEDKSLTSAGNAVLFHVRGRGGKPPLSVELVSTPAQGTAEVKWVRGSMLYRPKKGYVGTDSFTFRWVDAAGVASAPGTVTVTVLDPGEGRYVQGPRFTPPPHLEKTGAATNRLVKLGYLDVTAYDGWEGHPVDPTGAKDSTDALQKAIDDAYDYQLAVFFPAGVYTISDTLRVVKKRSRFAGWHGTTVVGSRKGTRPVIRLEAKAPGFGNPEKPKPMMWFWCNSEDHNRPFGAAGREFDPGNLQDNMGFNQSIENITFDCNGPAGNAGAIGLHFGGAQGSSICDVNVIATGAYAGFRDIPSRSSAGAANIAVEGGRYGLYLKEGAGSFIAGAALRNQTEAALYSTQFVPIAVAGFHIVKERGPAISLADMSWGTSGGSISLMDGIIEIGHGGGPALDNTAGRNFYARNVFVKGTDELVRSPAGVVKGTGAWKRLAEYAWASQHAPAQKEDWKRNDPNVPGFTLVDGAIGRDEMAKVVSDAQPPAPDLVRRHVWARLPSFEDPDCVVLTDVSAADGADDADDWAEIQKTIDAHAKVFVPKGLFRVGRALTLGPNTTFFGAGLPLSRIVPHPDWKPTGPAPVVQTVDDAGATTYLGRLTIGYPYGDPKHDWFCPLLWRAGRRSMVMGVSERGAQEGWSERSKLGKDMQLKTNPRALFTVTGNGGGRWYFFGVDRPTGRMASTHPAYRLLLIDGTREPLWLYGCNLEHPTCDTMAELRHARNVRILSVKVETHVPVIRIHDSENVALHGSGQIAEHLKDGKPYFAVTGKSNHILLSNLNPRAPGGGRGSWTLLEDGACGRVGIPYPGMVALYKRGELDDAAMWRKGR